jgi:hypothetical protein
MRNHCHRALFLTAGTVALHWRAVSALKILINNVKSSGNIPSH